MSNAPKTSNTTEVSERIFSAFLDKLSEANYPADVIDRMRKSLLQDKKFTEKAMREALFPKD